jgi:CHAD domain-containing protein
MALDANRIEKNIKKLRKIVKKAAKQPDPEEVHVRLLEHLGAERYRQARRLRRVIKQDGQEIRRGLKQTAAHLGHTFDAGRNGAAALQNHTPTEAAAAALRLSSELIEPPVLSHRNLHPYRLKVKELRYVLQMAEDRANAELVKSLGETKDAIGEWHDWEELTAIAAELLDHPNCKLIHRFKNISREKYESALAVTNKMWALCLHISGRGKKHRADTGLRPPQPAIKAASAIAA